MPIFKSAALLAASLLASCSAPEPRSQYYFEDHLDEARQVVAGCRDGSVRGGECDNADTAVQKAEAKERKKRFFGDGKAYTPPK